MLGFTRTDAVAARYRELQRGYHGIGHLEVLSDRIRETIADTELRTKLMALVLFHDAIYHPGNPANEAESAALLEGHGAAVAPAIREELHAAILETQWKARPDGALASAFAPFDLASLGHRTMGEHVRDTAALYKEFQYAGLIRFREGRRAFLRSFGNIFPELDGLTQAEAALDAWSPSVLVFAGSLDPFHIGHLDILRRAEQLADQVIVGVGVNMKKQSAALEDRLDRLRDQLRFHEVRGFGGLLTQLIVDLRTEGYGRVGLVRGLRGSADYRAEKNLARNLEDLLPGIPIALVHGSRGLEHISSSSIREIASFAGEEAVASKIPTRQQIYQLRSGDGS